MFMICWEMRFERSRSSAISAAMDGRFGDLASVETVHGDDWDVRFARASAALGLPNEAGFASSIVLDVNDPYSKCTIFHRKTFHVQKSVN
jgi:hypothetical protein